MNDLAYFGMRLRQEKAAARDAMGPEAHARHEELADAYDLRFRLLRKQTKSPQEQRVEEALESQAF